MDHKWNHCSSARGLVLRPTLPRSCKWHSCVTCQERRAKCQQSKKSEGVTPRTANHNQTTTNIMFEQDTGNAHRGTASAPSPSARLDISSYLHQLSTQQSVPAEGSGTQLLLHWHFLFLLPVPEKEPGPVGFRRHD